MELLGQALINGLLGGLVYSLIALGLSLIWGVMDIVNFAHAEYLMLAMFLTYWLWALAGLDPLMSLPLVAVVLFGLGVATYKIVIKRIIEAPMVSQIFTTFGLFLFLRYGAFALWGPDFRKVGDPLLQGSLLLGPFHVSLPKLGAAVAALLVFGGLHLFLTRTKTGKALQATAQDREVALSLGIDVEKMYVLAWGLGIASVGVAGVFLTNFYFVEPQVGTAFLLLAFASVTLGGFGTLVGALVGGVAIGLIEQVFGAVISPTFKLVFVFVIFILVLLVRPRGLVGEA
jgi:branched-chain amino acid transport system permease protein